MGCTQPRRTILPQNPIPIERVYQDGYPLRPSPQLVIHSTPSPVFVKSNLKKDHFDGRSNNSPLFRRNAGSTPKAVNFYQTVQVRCRTPTPNKVWYEKASSTMPMRRIPPNDDDDDDYEAPEEYEDDDDEDPRGISSQPLENDSNGFRMPSINRIGTPIPSSYSLQAFPPQSTVDSHSPFLSSSSSNGLQYNTTLPNKQSSRSANLIKVRRRLSSSEIPQVFNPVPTSSNFATEPVPSAPALPSIQRSVHIASNAVAPSDYRPITNTYLGTMPSPYVTTR